MEMEILLSRLPPEIKLSIFARLPVESVLECREVCKAWNDFLDFKKNTYFAYLHLGCNGGGLLEQHQQQQPHQHQGHFGSDSGIHSFVIFERQNLYYAEYHEEEENKFHTRMINLRIPVDVSEYGGSSCNGLICFATYKTEEPAYICNPVTSELVHLPRMAMDKKKKKDYASVSFVHGFGYDPLSGKYKVVRICYCAHKNKQLQTDAQVDVYTLGSGSGWRNIGTTGYSELSDESGSVFVNGALHWLRKETKQIVAFNLADEKFCSLPAPPGLSPYGTQSLYVINGCLCLLCQDPGKAADVWFRKKSMQGDFSWSLEFHIAVQFQFTYERHSLVCLANNGNAILLKFRGTLLQYNIETTTSEEIWRAAYWGRTSTPLLHVNSFVSMQALGEEDVKTFIGSSDDGTRRGGRKAAAPALKGYFQSKRTRIANGAMLN